MKALSSAIVLVVLEDPIPFISNTFVNVMSTLLINNPVSSNFFLLYLVMHTHYNTKKYIK